MRRTIGAIAGIGVAGLVLAACGSAPDDGGSTTTGAPSPTSPSPTETTGEPTPMPGAVKACMISDQGRLR